MFPPVNVRGAPRRKTSGTVTEKVDVRTEQWPSGVLAAPDSGRRPQQACPGPPELSISDFPEHERDLTAPQGQPRPSAGPGQKQNRHHPFLCSHLFGSSFGSLGVRPWAGCVSCTRLASLRGPRPTLGPRPMGSSDRRGH